MQLQAQPRFRKRIPCSVRLGGQRHSGLVLNVSSGGLFVQTSAAAEPGAGLAIELNLDAGVQSLALETVVVWRRVVAGHLRSISQGGVGLRIRNAPEPFYALLLRLQGGDSAPPPGIPSLSPSSSQAARRQSSAPAPAPPTARFRIRVKQTAGPRSKLLTISGASEREARDRALAQTGHGWTVLEVERIGS